MSIKKLFFNYFSTIFKAYLEDIKCFGTMSKTKVTIDIQSQREICEEMLDENVLLSPKCNYGQGSEDSL